MIINDVNVNYIDYGNNHNQICYIINKFIYLLINLFIYLFY